MTQLFVDPDISKARTLTTEFYKSPDFYEASKEKIFSSSWQFIGSGEGLREQGKTRPLTLLEQYLDEPLVLTMDGQQNLRLLSNVCTHRGNIIVDKPCSLNHLRCKYHGRLFNLDGRFHSMPEFKEVKNFPSPADHLTEIPLYQWGPWLFASLRPRVAAGKVFSEIQERLSWLPVQDFEFRPDLSRDFQVKAHWALYCENYLEGFHIPFVHAGLNAVIDFGNYSTELYPYSSLQLGIAKDGDACFDLPKTSADYGKKVAAYYYFVFPNLMLNFYPWGLSVNVVKPVSPTLTKVEFLTYVWKESRYNSGAGSNLDTVEMEDEEVVENVQKGIRSRYYPFGRYSVTREQGTHHFHRMITEWFQQ